MKTIHESGYVLYPEDIENLLDLMQEAVDLGWEPKELEDNEVGFNYDRFTALKFALITHLRHGKSREEL